MEVLTLAWCGALLSAETAKTHKISFNLLNGLNRPVQMGPPLLIWKELKCLAVQSGFRKPFVSAHGVFQVDFSILGVIIGSVTSYIIVVQQYMAQCDGFHHPSRENVSSNELRFLYP